MYVPRTTPEQTGKYRYNLNKVHHSDVMIGNYDFSVLENRHVEGIWNDVRTLILDSMETCIPKLSCGTNKRLKPLWMTHKVLKSVKKKYNLCKGYLLSKQGKNFDKYKLLRNKCNKIIN